MECMPRTNLEVFGAHSSPSPFNPKTSFWYALCQPHSHESQAVINKCSIYREVNSKCQIEYHERGHQTECHSMRAETLSCSSVP